MSGFSRGQVVDWYRKFHVPNNMVLAAVGNFPEGEFSEMVRETLGSLPQGPLPDPAAGEPPVRAEPEEAFERRESQAVWVALGYPAPPLTDRGYAAMEVLDAILGGSMDSRLFVSVRDTRGLAYQVGSSYIAMGSPSLFLVYLGTRPEQFEEAKAVALGEVERMAEEPVLEEELRAAKTFLKGTFLMSQERNIDQAALLARFELMGLGYGFVEEYPELIEAVTREEVQRAAREYLAGPYVLGAVVPEGE
ncbi:MAG TPA: insulinase family protein [Candidatus Latescibacteria bacterium]|nr:insulinase family protein [Candidatus Latescibacterota bacterium]